jgi:hypothetical protein
MAEDFGIIAERNAFMVKDGVYRIWGGVTGVHAGLVCLFLSCGNLVGEEIPEQAVLRVLSEERVEDISSRNTNQRVWAVKREVEVSDALTGEPVVEEIVGSVVEVGNGICYRNKAGVWQPATPAWRCTANGFALEGVGYALQAGDTIAAGVEYTVDGETMALRATKITVQSAGVEHVLYLPNGASAGVIDANDPSRLVFADAFGPGVGVEYVAGSGGYHQNVVLHSEPVLGEGMESDSTQILIYTEILTPACAENETIEADAENIFRADIGDIDLADADKEDIRLYKRTDTGETVQERQIARFVESLVFDSGRETRQKSAAARKSLRREGGRLYLVESLEYGFFAGAEYPVVWDYSTVSGSLTVDTVWYAQNTYYVSGDLTVDNCELRIEPGTFVKFADIKKLTTSNGGTIIARGKPYLNIVFTSEKDTANGEYISSGTVSKGKWGGIKLSKNSEFEFCSVFYSAGVDIEGPLAIHFQHNYLYCNYNSIDVVSTAIGESESLTIFNNLIVPDPCTPDPCDLAIRIDGPMGTTGNIYIRNNTIHLAGNGVYLATSCAHDIVMENNIFSSCWCGIKADTGYAYSRATSNHDGFYNNTSYFSMPYGWSPADATAITTNPFFTDSSYNNYLLNDSEPGGMNFVDTGSDTAANIYGDVYEWAVHNLKDVAASRVFTSSQPIPTDTTWSRQTATCDTGRGCPIRSWRLRRYGYSGLNLVRSGQ